MPKHHFEGKDHTGDGCVKGCRDAGCDAATEQGLRLLRVETQMPTYERGNGAAKMDHRAFAPGGAAKAKGCSTNNSGAESTIQANMRPTKRAGFDDLRHSLSLAARHHIFEE